MTATLKIDFVSDVSCPWCAIGLGALEMALDRVKDEVQAELHFQPFELNPQMGPGGQDVSEHLTQKYGSTAEQQAQARQVLGGTQPVHALELGRRRDGPQDHVARLRGSRPGHQSVPRGWRQHRRQWRQSNTPCLPKEEWFP